MLARSRGRELLGDTGHLRVGAGAGAIVVELLVDGVGALAGEAGNIGLRKALVAVAGGADLPGQLQRRERYCRRRESA